MAEHTLDGAIAPVIPQSRFPAYTAMRASRAEFLADLQAWLITQPSASLALTELAAAQEMLTDLHNLAMGQLSLRGLAER